MLHDDISHAIPVGIPVLVEPMDSTKNKLVEGNGAILAAYHLQGKRVVNSQLSVEKESALPIVRSKCQRSDWLHMADVCACSGNGPTE